MSIREKHPYLVVYDGDCGLCAKSVQFILRHDAAGRFRFCPIQSPLGAAICAEAGIDPKDPSSFIAIVGGRLHIKSRAMLQVAISFGRLWTLLRLLLIVSPKLLDPLYDWVARRRKSICPSMNQCPTDPTLKSRILLDP